MNPESKKFIPDMTIADALAVEPEKVGSVFASYHLGGCAHCHVSRVETIGQVCAGYGIDQQEFLEALETAVSEPA